eukprot:2570372-Prymnesium_polylepis.1
MRPPAEGAADASSAAAAAALNVTKRSGCTGARTRLDGGAPSAPEVGATLQSLRAQPRLGGVSHTRWTRRSSASGRTSSVSRGT